MGAPGGFLTVAADDRTPPSEYLHRVGGGGAEVSALLVRPPGNARNGLVIPRLPSWRRWFR
jgi:hypothetical protein